MSDFAKDTNVLNNDCISRQAAYATALAMYVRCDTGNIEDYRDLMCESILALPSAQQWIPCSERLPDTNGDYLVTGRQGAVNKRGYEDGYWYGNWSVIAWMPLPKPYKGE